MINLEFILHYPASGLRSPIANRNLGVLPQSTTPIYPMKKILYLLILFISFAGCKSDDRQKLIVYTPHGKELVGDYEKSFEALHPEINVEFQDMGAQQIYDRIRTEKKRPQASLWWGAPSVTFARAAKEDLLAPYQPTWSAAIDSVSCDPNHMWYGNFYTPEVITFNSRTVENPPADWDDFLLPEWKDEIIIRYPLQSGTMRTIWGAMIMRQPTVEEGYAWLARLDRNTKTYAADPAELYIKLAREEGEISLWNQPDTDIQSRDNNYPFAYLIPESGTPILTDGIAIVKNAPNAEAAKAFYEFVTSIEAMIDQADKFYRFPARNDIPQDQLPAWMQGLDLKPMEMDWKRLADNEADWMEYWDENIKGRGEKWLQERNLD